VEALREHGKRQSVERMAAVRWDDPDVVFASTVGTFLEPRRVNTILDKLTKRAGLVGVHPHTLRHSTAVALLAAGEPLPVVSEIMGHGSSIVTATIYSHVLPSSRVSAAATLDRAFGGSWLGGLFMIIV
jgi:site-specific recombinase XerD